MKRITVKDLAKELNVSLGTINKAFNNKPGLSDETRRKVLETAELMGYKVNRVAQSLARNSIKIGIITPEAWPEYYGYLKAGINQELERLRDYNIIGKIYSVPGLHSNNETIQALENCKSDGMDAIILSPAHETKYIEQINELYKSGIPVIALGSDLAGSKRMSCVRVDAIMSGRLAAEYMGWIVEKSRNVAVFTGNKDMSDHKEKIEGFIEEAKNRSLNIVGVFETHDEPEVAYYLTGKLIKEIPDLGGIYVATGNSESICRYIKDNNVQNVRIIGTDIFKKIIGFVKDDIMQGVIFQDPITQGKLAVRIIYDLLVHKKPIQENIFVTPQLVLRSNIDSYNDLLNGGL